VGFSNNVLFKENQLMPALHKDHDLHLEIILEVIKNNEPLAFIQIVGKIEENKETVKKLDLTKYLTDRGQLPRKCKERILYLIKQLKKEGRIESIEHEDRGTLYQIQKKEQINQEKVTIIPIKKKKKNSKQDQEGWITWSNPELNQETNTWEYHKKDETGNILESFSNESEEEIIKEHAERVSNHIINTLQQENPQLPNKQPLIKRKKERENKVLSISKTSVEIEEEVQYEMFQLKIKGYSYWDIIKDTSNKYNLTLSSVSLYYQKLLNFIKEKSGGLIEETITEHSDRYEQLYKWFKENGYDRIAIKALQAREKLLGVNEDENSNLLILNHLSEKGLGFKKYDYEQLSENERNRLIGLIKKTLK
jgi:hypothetical protein